MLPGTGRPQDRRARRTRERIQAAFLELLRERPYDRITVRDIARRADVGRATFYAHFRGKDDLLLSCHERILEELPLFPASREELRAADPPPGMRQAFRHLVEARPVLAPLFQGFARDSAFLLRRMREVAARIVETRLRAALSGADGAVPVELLAQWLAGAQLALVQWWLEERRPHDPDRLAEAVHRWQRAVLHAVWGAGEEP